MSPSELKVLFVCAESAPYASVGGLGQVSYFLTKALKKLGVDVSIFMPKYGKIDEKKYKIEPFLKGVKVPTGEKTGRTELICNVKVRYGGRKEPTVYFLENMEYYEQRANVYGYMDDPVRFCLLSRAVLEFIRQSGLRPNVLHCNDWHTGFVANYLRRLYLNDNILKFVSSVYTIHNLGNQGNFDFKYASPMDFDDGKSMPIPLFTPGLHKQNALKRGIIYSDVVNTVSENYAREMMTPEYGEGLHDLVKEVRGKVFGILNGLDYNDFDPSDDKVIKTKFNWQRLDKRLENKIDLQKEFSLEADPQIPIIGMSGRLYDQKGLDLVTKVLPHLLQEYKMQFVVLGTGDAKYKEFFTKLEAEYPGRVGTHLMANFSLPRKIFAGADMLLLPSKFEPGGIVVIEAMRYGAVPIVRATGGLADIVTDYDPRHNSGTGFVFKNYNDLSLLGAVVRALQVYQNNKAWPNLVRRVLKEDFSWDKVAKKYVDLYERATEFRKDRQSPIQTIGRVIES